MRAIEKFEIESGELTINVSVVCYECFDGFADQWEGTDKHQGGVTIAEHLLRDGFEVVRIANEVDVRDAK